MGEVAENLHRVREELASACRRAGRRADEVALMAVSKVHPAELMEEAYAAGQRLFGENRVQEWEGKANRVRSLGSDLCVHLIGPLQNNKTAKAAALFDAVDTLDTTKTAQRLATSWLALPRGDTSSLAVAGASGAAPDPAVIRGGAETVPGADRAGTCPPMPVLLEVKLSPEESKHGVDPHDLFPLLEQVSATEGIEVRGLMTVPPWSEDPETARPYFQRLRALRDEVCVRFPTVRELSMGMSNDFAVAIEEGSTTVRVGTAIFGRRPAPTT